MKVLYIGHYKEFGGWSQAATDNILALDSVGIDVVCRNVTLTKDKDDINPRILQLEQKDSKTVIFVYSMFCHTTMFVLTCSRKT